MVKAIIFDCFGVLITDALQSLVDEVRSSDAARADRITGLVGAAMAGRIDAATSRAAVASELGISPVQYAEKIKNAEVKNVPLLRYIKTLRATYKIGLLSNVLSGGLTVRFGKDELALFHVVAASGEIGYAKPDAQAYEYVADQLQVRLDECVMIDDRQDYCDGAEQVGMKAIRYESFDQMRRQLEASLA